MIERNANLINIGCISRRLGFNVSEAFLQKIGFTTVTPYGHAKLYKEKDFQLMCIAIRRHISEVQKPQKVVS